MTELKRAKCNSRHRPDDQEKQNMEKNKKKEMTEKKRKEEDEEQAKQLSKPKQTGRDEHEEETRALITPEAQPSEMKFPPGAAASAVPDRCSSLPQL